MSQRMDGKAVAAFLRENMKTEARTRRAEGIVPTLAVVMVGDNPASAVYVRNKQKAAADVGIESRQVTLPALAREEELLALIDRLNADETVHGILVQLPLPSHIDEAAVIFRIAPEKDVDAFHPQTVGRLVAGDPTFLPCTPAGVTELLKYYHVQTAGKHCVIVGRSNIVGKPMFHLMLAADATVTVCHSKTEHLSDYTKDADILIAAVGRPKFIGADMVKEGAVVIDVGINRTEDGKLCGDVDYDAVSEKASLITPVPGGVGPMTVAMLLKNTLRAAEYTKFSEKNKKMS